jgi:catalase
LLAQVDKTLATRVADGLGMSIPTSLDKPLNMSVPADVDPKKLQPKKVRSTLEASPVLSMVNNRPPTISTRKIAFLVADGFDDQSVAKMKTALLTEGAKALTVAPRLGVLTGANGETLKADFSFLTGSSVLFDAVYVPAGEESVAALKDELKALDFLTEAYEHCKSIAAAGAGIELLQAAGLIAIEENEIEVLSSGIILGRGDDYSALATEFITDLQQHRHWEREESM